MKNSDLKKNILWLVCKQQGGIILLDIFTLLGSAVTIWCAYFDRPFKINFLLDWIVAAFICFILIILIIRCLRLILKWESLNFPKDIFFQYISMQAIKASNSIKSIAGDLSWLAKQKETYEKIRKEKTHVSITIYYSEEGVINNTETQSLINEYLELGIRMIPYPFKIQTKHTKGILIDTDENARFLSFLKQKEGDVISCTKYYHDANEFSLAHAFIESIDNYIKLRDNLEQTKINKSVFIGVSGLNNIGKSSLCLELKLKYGEKVIVIEDSFISDTEQSSFEVALFCLLNQIFEFTRLKKELSDKTIFIFDRTPIDNFAFLKLYKTTKLYDRYIERLENEIRNFMVSFDIIALLIPDEKGYKYKDTSHLKTETRKRVPTVINTLYRRIYSEKITKYKVKKYSKSTDFAKRIKEIVEDIVKKINIE